MRKEIEVGAGEQVRVVGRGGWVYDLIGTESGADVEVSNPVEGGGEKFFTFSTVGNPYGAGKIVQERTLGISTEHGRIVGALILDESGKIVERFSWSNAVYAKRQTVEIVAGELFIAGASKGHLAAAFMPDKNRLDGLVGIFKPTKSETVKVLEMEDLLLASI
ncbi:MAG: hypothetical protein Q8L10_02130 [Candidatus Moranbacteria bacterium]|nr:hypothetical protein [Candidatus Moranbacteria bacterium]